MVVSCEQVWREISNYLEGDVEPQLRAAMDDHIHGCKNCTAVLEGTRNIVQLYGDERMIDVPVGYSQRLHRRLEENMPRPRRTFLGWMVAAAAAVLVAGTFEVARSFVSSPEELRSEHARPATGVPPELSVLVSPGGKLFHRHAKCPLLHDKANARAIPAHEALQQGYTPCVRCMKEYL